MINLSATHLTTEPSLDPSCDPFEEYKRIFIESKIEEFVELIMRKGVSHKHDSNTENLLDCLYECIEEKIDNFLTEPIYEI
ncbi:hypothetical protein LCGC14_1232530 [marine sediment metagenome]|uniref:Uncharacterized protein n=1 Tax=marine sediment metagenome TaxID=412755 RepID=A0A0F9LVC0_9ZZZZ